MFGKMDRKNAIKPLWCFRKNLNCLFNVFCILEINRFLIWCKYSGYYLADFLILFLPI